MQRISQRIDDFNRTKREEGEPVMTQKRLAELTGLNEVTVHRHVRGRTQMSLRQALAYARALRCSVEDLAGPGDEAA